MGYTLTTVVNELMIELGYTQSNQEARLYQLALAGLREFNMDMGTAPKVVELEIQSNDRVNLPSDYLNYTRIAVCGADGQLHSLGQNPNLCLNQSFNDCGEPIRHTSDQPYPGSVYWGGYYWSNHFRNGEMMGRFFGIGGGNNANGYYRFDPANGQILLGEFSCHTTSIVLEYIADVSSIDGDFAVHPFLIETLKNWTYWKLIARDRTRNANEKQMAMIDFQKAQRISLIRFNSRTSEDWLMAFRSGNKGAPKF